MAGRWLYDVERDGARIALHRRSGLRADARRAQGQRQGERACQRQT
jgi:hypothetical protein